MSIPDRESEHIEGDEVEVHQQEACTYNVELQFSRANCYWRAENCASLERSMLFVLIIMQFF